jgi:hypothetical protein
VLLSTKFGRFVVIKRRLPVRVTRRDGDRFAQKLPQITRNKAQLGSNFIRVVFREKKKAQFAKG